MSEALILCPKETLVPVVMAEALALKESALAGVALIGAIETAEQNASAVEAVAVVTSLKNKIKRAHKDAKEPFLRVCQALDKTRNDLLADLEAEELRVNQACGEYQMAQEEIRREAERARQRELDRIERERREEEQRIAEAARKVEQERLAEERRKAQAIADEQARVARELAQATTKKAREEAAIKAAELEQERLKAAAAADVARHEAEARQARERAEREALAAQEREAVGPAKQLDKTAGQSIKVEWDFEVTSIYDLAKVRPDLVRMEPRTLEIKEAINLGMRELRGIRIFETAKTRVRPGSVGQKAIEV
jgi:chromosome segregation ATPase